MMKNISLPEAFRGFEVCVTFMPEHRHIDLLIDIPEKKIYLNRAADKTANVAQVVFSRRGIPAERDGVPRRHGPQT